MSPPPAGARGGHRPEARVRELLGEFSSPWARPGPSPPASAPPSQQWGHCWRLPLPPPSRAVPSGGSLRDPGLASRKPRGPPASGLWCSTHSSSRPRPGCPGATPPPRGSWAGGPGATPPRQLGRGPGAPTVGASSFFVCTSLGRLAPPPLPSCRAQATPADRSARLAFVAAHAACGGRPSPGARAPVP